jgi:hypothetical protein
MSTHNEEEIRPEENPNQGLPKEPEHNSEGISATQVLETMKNLIVELQVFKADNEKMKKAQEDQLEINEMLLRSIVTKRSPKNNDKEEEVNKRSSKNFGHETKNEDSSSEDTHMTGNKTTMGRKTKQVDHLEGEFKKINRPPLIENKGRVKRIKNGY